MKKFSLYEYQQEGLNYDFSKCEQLNLKNAVNAKCLECCAFNGSEAYNCNSKDCALWFLRKKYFPSRICPQKQLTEEERKVIAERMKANINK